VLRKEAATPDRSTAVVEEVPISSQERVHASNPLKKRDVADAPTIQAALEMPSSGGESRLPRVEYRLAERFEECGGFGRVLFNPRRHTTEKEVEVDTAISSGTPPANEVQETTVAAKEKLPVQEDPKRSMAADVNPTMGKWQCLPYVSGDHVFVPFSMTVQGEQRSPTFPNLQSKGIQFGPNIVMAMPAPAFKRKLSLKVSIGGPSSSTPSSPLAAMPQMEMVTGSPTIQQANLTIPKPGHPPVSPVPAAGFAAPMNRQSLPKPPHARDVVDTRKERTSANAGELLLTVLGSLSEAQWLELIKISTEVKCPTEATLHFSMSPFFFPVHISNNTCKVLNSWNYRPVRTCFDSDKNVGQKLLNGGKKTTDGIQDKGTNNNDKVWKNPKTKHSGQRRTTKEVERQEALHRQKREEEVRKQQLEEVNRQIRELQKKKMQLSGVEAGIAPMKTQASPRESYKEDGSSSLGGLLREVRNVKQVSGLAKSKVNNVALFLVVSSDVSRSNCCADPLLLDVWPVPKEIPLLQLSGSLRPIRRY
jgi:hypothetical protein